MPKDFSLLGFTNLKSYAIILYAVKRYAPVAQLDRALDSDVSGRFRRAMAQSLAISGLQPTEAKNSPVVDYYLTTILQEPVV